MSGNGGGRWGIRMECFFVIKGKNNVRWNVTHDDDGFLIDTVIYFIKFPAGMYFSIGL